MHALSWSVYRHTTCTCNARSVATLISIGSMHTYLQCAFRFSKPFTEQLRSFDSNEVHANTCSVLYKTYSHTVHLQCAFRFPQPFAQQFRAFYSDEVHAALSCKCTCHERFTASWRSIQQNSCCIITTQSIIQSTSAAIVS